MWGKIEIFQPFLNKIWSFTFGRYCLSDYMSHIKTVPINVTNCANRYKYNKLHHFINIKGLNSSINILSMTPCGDGPLNLPRHYDSLIDSLWANHMGGWSSPPIRMRGRRDLRCQWGGRSCAVYGYRLKRNSRKFTAHETLRMNGTAYSNFDNQEHVLKLGETFEKHPKSAYHTVRCKWQLGSHGLAGC